MKVSEFKKLIREEVRNVISEKQKLNEDMALVGDIALGVAGGLAGLWALLRGTPVVLSALGSVAGEIASSIQDKARKAAEKARREGRLETIKPIVAKFANDETLKNMYKALPEYSNSITSKAGMQNRERAKQMKAIAEYIKSKLSPEEMEFFQDVSSMLRTGDIKEAAVTAPTSYDFNNPGDEWKNIITKAMERFNKFPKNPKVKKDTINLFTAIYKLGFKKIGQKKQMSSAEGLANNVIGAGGRNNDVMQKSVDDVIAYIKNDIDPTAIPNWADYDAKKEFKAGKWTRITPQTKLKVGDEIVRMNDLMFADIVKMEGDKVFLHFAVDYYNEKPTKKTRDVLEDYYLLMNKK